MDHCGLVAGGIHPQRHNNDERRIAIGVCVFVCVILIAYYISVFDSTTKQISISISTNCTHKIVYFVLFTPTHLKCTII